MRRPRAHARARRWRGGRARERGRAPSGGPRSAVERADGSWLHDEGGAGGGALSCALGGDVLSVAGPVDLDADGVHREAVEDGRGEGGVAEKASPVAERDIR